VNRRAFLDRAARIAAGAATASLSGCGHNLAPPPAVPPPPLGVSGPASLGAHAAQHSLLYGCAVNVPALAADPTYAGLVREQCRILVAENAMKWAAVHPALETFRFDEADALLTFAELNHLKIRGHNLAWHRDNPAWLATSATSANARALLTTHIETVAGRYAGRMHSWDVVNEAIQVSDGRQDGMRLSPWLALVGDDYLELAFRTARNADPQALLAYNDYGVEGEDPASERKRQAILQMLRRTIARRVPIDAVGIQSHLAAPLNAGPGLLRFIAAIRQLGLQVFLSELDINDRALPASESVRDAAVAAAYKQYLALVLADPAVRVVQTWGITDRYTWLNHEGARADRLPERCLPFDTQCQPKAAFYAMREAFDRRSQNA